MLRVAGLIQRAAALPPDAQQVLHVAAVAGRQTPRRALLAAALASSMSEAGALAALEAAAQARLLVDGADGSYAFAHDLIREAIVADLGPARKATLHRHVAEALERLPGRERRAAELAWHFAQGDEPARALPYALVAGDQAAAAYAHAEAERHYRTALAAAQELGDQARKASALEKFGATLVALERYGAALPVLEQAAQASRATGDIEAVARALEQLGAAHLGAGLFHEGILRVQSQLDALAHHGLSPAGTATVHLSLSRLFHSSRQHALELAAAERALDLARSAGDARLMSRAAWRRGFALQFLGQLEEAIPAQEEAIRLLEGRGDAMHVFNAAFNLAAYFYFAGELVAAERYQARALAAAEQGGNPTQLIHCAIARGDLAFIRGRWSQAHDDYQQAEALLGAGATTWGQRSAAYLALGQGIVYLARGQHTGGIAAVERAVVWAERVSDFQIHHYAQVALAERDLLVGDALAARDRLAPMPVDRHGRDDVDVTDCLPILAWAYLELGDRLEAERLAARALAGAEAMHRRLALVDALRIRALVAVRGGRAQEAETALEEALARCRAMAYPYAEVKALHVYGQLEVARGDPAAARTRFTQALLICDRLGEGLYQPRIKQDRDRISQSVR